MPASSCRVCGMLLNDPGEFHPHAFCVWKKAGLDPWNTLLWVNQRLGIDTTHWPRQSPLIRDLSPQYKEAVENYERTEAMAAAMERGRRR